MERIRITEKWELLYRLFSGHLTYDLGMSWDLVFFFFQMTRQLPQCYLLNTLSFL